MGKPIHILLQTTIPSIDDDWDINRFSLLRDHLSSITDDAGQAVFKVTARDRETNGDGNDLVPADWQALRERWDFYHALRTFVSIAALAAVTGSALLDRSVKAEP